MDPIDHAREGDVKFFRENEVTLFINFRDYAGDSVLNEAVRHGHFECSKVILERCPQLLYVQSSRHTYSALHWAAIYSRSKITKLLIDGAQTRLFRMLDTEGRSALQIAVEKMNVEIVNMLSEADPNYVFPADENGQTPLSVALRLSSGKSDNHASVKIRKLLLKTQPKQCKQRTGDMAWTILHHSTCTGDIGAVQDLIQFRPGCMKLVDKNGQNFLHIAAKNGHVKILKHALHTEEVTADILNKQDNEGNTPLHIACQNGNKNVVSCLLYDPRVNKMAVNDENEKVLDLVTFDYDKEKVFGGDENVLKLSVSAEHRVLYTCLVEKFGEIVHSDLPEFKVGPTGQVLNHFLEVVSEILVTTTAYISEKKLLEWERMSTYYSHVGLQIDWFTKCVSLFRDLISKHGKVKNRPATEFARKKKAVGRKRMELATLEADLEVLRVALKTIDTGDSKV